MTRTAFQPAARGARGAWADPTTAGGPPVDAPATVAPPDGETVVSTFTTRYGHDVTASPAGGVLVDLAQAEPASVGCVVDLAEEDVPAAVTSPPTGRRSADRIGGAGRLSPSWPSVLRVTSAFGTTDLIDAREGATP